MTDKFYGECIIAPCCERADLEVLIYQPFSSGGGEWGLLQGIDETSDIVLGDFCFCPYCGTKLPEIPDAEMEAA